MLEVYEWSGLGFAPLVFTEGWQAALLNWEPLFDRKNLDEIERHNHTDEVFVLLRGRAMIFTRADDEALQAVEMQRGKIYNVPARVWHNLVATRDVILSDCRKPRHAPARYGNPPDHGCGAATIGRPTAGLGTGIDRFQLVDFYGLPRRR